MISSVPPEAANSNASLQTINGQEGKLPVDTVGTLEDAFAAASLSDNNGANGSTIDSGSHRNMSKTGGVVCDNSNDIGLNWGRTSHTNEGFHLDDNRGNVNKNESVVDGFNGSATEKCVTPPRKVGQSTSPLHRKRGESIDMFLSMSPSKSLGSEFLKFKNNSLDNLNNTASTGSRGPAMVANSNKVLPPPGIGRDQSPPCSITATTVSGATTSTGSVSPAFNHSSQGHHLPSGGKYGSGILHQNSEQGMLPTKMTIQRHHSHDVRASSNFSTGQELLNMASTSDKNPSQREFFHEPQNNLHEGKHRQHKYQEKPAFPGYGYNNENGHVPQNPTPQPMWQEAVKPSQVFYMAVPMQDGSGQVLQQIEMVQLPGQAPTLMLPTRPGETAPQPITMLQQGGQAPVMMVAPPAVVGGNNNVNNHYGNRRGGHKHSSKKNNSFKHHGGAHVNKCMNGSNLPYNETNNDCGQNLLFHSKGTDNSNMYDRNNLVGGYNSVHQDMIPSSSSTCTDSVELLYSSPHRPPLQDLLGHVRQLSRDQVGCRLLQQALEEEGPTAATCILREGLSFWGEAMVDPFGNYLFQKILEKITVEERVVLIKSVSSRLVNASLNLHGTRSVQKIVELCAMDDVDLSHIHTHRNHLESDSSAKVLTNSLAAAAARLCIDSHGNHVIQRILLKLSYHHSQFVFDSVAASVSDVARHRHGCCVIQRCLDSPPSHARSHLVSRIVENSLELMQDAYGNYVVQYVLDVCSDDDVHAVCESVVGKVNLLAIQKFSSNVMEKCLERCTDRVRKLYVKELCECDRIRELMVDPFGNYVIQRALSVATHSQAVRLVEAMKPHLLSFTSVNGTNPNVEGTRNTAGGRRIMAKISRRFPNFSFINCEGFEGKQQIKITNEPYHEENQMASRGVVMNCRNSHDQHFQQNICNQQIGQYQQQSVNQQHHNFVQSDSNIDFNHLKVNTGDCYYQRHM